MIIFKFKEYPETRGNNPGNTINWPCDVARWVIDIGWRHVGLYHQYRLKSTREWRNSHSLLYEACVTKYFHLGPSHAWYDGPHCSYSFGFIHVNYHPPGGRCKKCEGN
jgi:hypothetical protein